MPQLSTDILPALANNYLKQTAAISANLPTLNPEMVQYALREGGPISQSLGYNDVSQIMGLTPAQVEQMGRDTLTPFEQLQKAGALADQLYGRAGTRQALQTATAGIYGAGTQGVIHDLENQTRTEIEASRETNENVRTGARIGSAEKIAGSHIQSTEKIAKWNNATRRWVAKVTTQAMLGNGNGNGAFAMGPAEISAQLKVLADPNVDPDIKSTAINNLARIGRIPLGKEFPVVMRETTINPFGDKPWGLSNKTENWAVGRRPDGSYRVVRKTQEADPIMWMQDPRAAHKRMIRNPNYGKPTWEEVPQVDLQSVTGSGNKSGGSTSIPAGMLPDFDSYNEED